MPPFKLYLCNSAIMELHIYVIPLFEYHVVIFYFFSERLLAGAPNHGHQYGRVPVDLVFHAARCCPFQEGKSGIQSLDTAFEVCRLQHASSLISLLLEPVVQCFPHDIHFLPAFIERIFTEAFRQ